MNAITQANATAQTTRGWLRKLDRLAGCANGRPSLETKNQIAQGRQRGLERVDLTRRQLGQVSRQQIRAALKQSVQGSPAGARDRHDHQPCVARTGGPAEVALEL